MENEFYIARELKTTLSKWHRKKNKKPIILQGIRRVGKTTFVNKFGNEKYDKVAYFNFKENDKLCKIFDIERDPEETIEWLSYYVGGRINPETTLIHLDDIDHCIDACNYLPRFNELSKRFSIIGSGSYFSDFEGVILPGLDLNLRVTNDINLFANTGYTYRVPTYTDLFYIGPQNIGNPNLTPEVALSYEAGARFYNKNITLQASYFVREGNNIIDYTRPDDLSSPWQPNNLVKLNTNGVDVDGQVKTTWTKWINRVGFGYTFLRIRAASSIVIVPVPLSVAPVAPSQESKCAERMMYSFGNSFPGMVAIVLKVGTVPNSLDSATIFIFGFAPCSTMRYNIP